MWQIYYIRAQELAQERLREADRERWVRRSQPARDRRRLDGLRRGGALVAASLARRLDECVAREALAAPDADERLQSAT